jgi:hypothetical protein
MVVGLPLKPRQKSALPSHLRDALHRGLLLGSGVSLEKGNVWDAPFHLVKAKDGYATKGERCVMR